MINQQATTDKPTGHNETGQQMNVEQTLAHFVCKPQKVCLQYSRRETHLQQAKSGKVINQQTTTDKATGYIQTGQQAYIKQSTTHFMVEIQTTRLQHSRSKATEYRIQGSIAAVQQNTEYKAA